MLKQSDFYHVGIVTDDFDATAPVVNIDSNGSGSYEPGVDTGSFLDEVPEGATRTVFMTGGAFTPKAQQFLGSRAPSVLEKPFTNTELFSFIAESLSRTT